MVRWLFVQAAIQFWQCIKCITLIWVYKRRNHDEKLKLCIDAANLLLLKTSTIGWMIYAHTFQFSEDGYSCKYLTRTVRLWDLIMVCIIIGYLSLLHLVIILITLACVLSKD